MRLQRAIQALFTPYSFFTTTCLVSLSSPLSISKPVKLCLFLLFFVCRSHAPLVWLGRVMIYPILLIRFRYEVAKRSKLSPKAKQLGLTRPEDQAFPAIGVSPYEFTITVNEYVDIGSTDHNLHLSNSVYSRHADLVRGTWIFNAISPAYRYENVFTVFASTQFLFLREIPLFADFDMECRIASWDGRWLYLLTRFLMKPNKKDEQQVLDSKGRPRSLATLHLGKLCFKFGGRGKQLDMRKALMSLGFDVTGQIKNWNHCLELRKNKAIKEWLVTDSPADPTQADANIGLMEFEDRRLHALDLINKLGNGDKYVWRQLHDVVYELPTKN